MLDFGLHLGTHFPPKSFKILRRRLTPPRFLSSSLLVASLGYPLAPISSILDQNLEDFGRIFDVFPKLFFYVSKIFPVTLIAGFCFAGWL